MAEIKMDHLPLKKQSDFEKAARPLIKYLAENHHPHTKVVVTSNYAELLKGIETTGEILDYLKD